MFWALLYGLICVISQLRFDYNIFLALLVCSVIINIINLYGKIKLANLQTQHICNCSKTRENSYE